MRKIIYVYGSVSKMQHCQNIFQNINSVKANNAQMKQLATIKYKSCKIKNLLYKHKSIECK